MDKEIQLILEKHLNQIISGCRLGIKLTIFVGFIVAILLVGAVIYKVVTSPNIELAIIIGAVLILLIVLVTIAFICFHLHSCVNSCEFIKIMLLGSGGGISSAAKLMRETSCTKNMMDGKTLGKILNPASGG